MKKVLFTKSSWSALFLYYIFSLEVFLFISSFSLVNESLMIDSYVKQLAYDRAVELVEQQLDWRWVGYLVLPFFSLFQFFVISCIVCGGLLLFGLDFEFSTIFKATIVSEFVYLLPLLFKFIYFGFFFRTYTLEDIHAFAPLSLAQVIDVSQVPLYLEFTARSVTLFLAGYILLLAFSLSQLLERQFTSMLVVVIASYGSSWLVMQVFIIFLLISFS